MTPSPSADPPEARPLACNMLAIPPERRAGHEALTRRLFGTVARERRGLPDGYAWRFAGADYADVVDFVADERRCCPFITFTITVAADGGPVWLHLTGDAEIKDVIRAEFGIVEQDGDA
jgi:hypothetical protein